MIYPLFFKVVLQRIDAENAHRLARRVSCGLMRPPIVRRFLRSTLVPRKKEIQVEALGQTFPSPLGVAAGLDKEVDWFDCLGLLGFGFVEVGTVTALPQEGAARPRVARRTAQHALLNWMGFPNPGAAIAAGRLRRRSTPILVGANVGRSEGVAPESAADDYRDSVRQLGPLSHYVVLNVSSPNTPGLQGMQAAEWLRPLVSGVREELEAAAPRVPLLIKISPDLADHSLDAICDLSLELGLDGIVATNTTTNLESVSASSEGEAHPRGGLSGRPLKARSLEVLRRIYSRVGDSLVLVSVGGIETPDDAWERVLAGATLVQSHTGFVYGGPLWPHRINRGLARRVRKAGQTSIQELIGAETKGGVSAPSTVSGALVSPGTDPKVVVGA